MTDHPPDSGISGSVRAGRITLDAPMSVEVLAVVPPLVAEACRRRSEHLQLPPQDTYTPAQAWQLLGDGEFVTYDELRGAGFLFGMWPATYGGGS